MRWQMNFAAFFFISRPTDGYILAVSRKNNYDDFGLPGGGNEYGESLLDTAIRELKEETGLDTNKESCVSIYSSFYKGRKRCFVQTYISTKIFGFIKHEYNGGRIAWVHPTILMRGSFGVYNLNLIESLKYNHLFSDIEWFNFNSEQEIYPLEDGIFIDTSVINNDKTRKIILSETDPAD